jgi:hypothetical protein
LELVGIAEDAEINENMIARSASLVIVCMLDTAQPCRPVTQLGGLGGTRSRSLLSSRSK